jgi:hypothetical protein
MHHGAHPVQLLDHEPPARCRLQRHLELAVMEALNELTDTGAAAGVTRARETSPLDVSSQSAVICARC